MTKTKVRLQCPECAEKFYALTLNPECCPHCGYEYDILDDTVIQMPSLRGANTRTFDKTYRDLEKSSEARAEQAASMLGVPAADMAHMKITDMRDNVQPGESYAVPPRVSQPMQQVMQSAPVGAVGAEVGQYYAANVKQGFAPNAGARTLQSIQRNLFMK